MSEWSVLFLNCMHLLLVVHSEPRRPAVERKVVATRIPRTLAFKERAGIMKYGDVTRVASSVLAFVSLSICAFALSAAEYPDGSLSVDVTVDLNDVGSRVNRNVLGNNIIGYRSGWIADAYNRFGGGLWNPSTRAVEPEYLTLLEEAGVSVLRWPGGKWREDMDWKSKLVGKDRQPFGLPEFLSLCNAIGAEPVITLSAEYAADIDIPALIAYLNQPLQEGRDDKSQNWAKERGQDGHMAPYGVRWFEFGNENFNSAMSAEEYVERYRVARRQIKEISPAALLGAVLEDTDNVESGWTGKVLSELATEMDFGIIHPYIPMVTEGAIAQLGIERLLDSSLYADANFEYRLARYQEAARLAGRQEHLPLAATEYNAHFTQDEPYPIRHTLSTALHNADFIRVMLKPNSNILFANYWHLSNGYWGMLKGYPHKNEKIERRPNYYVYSILNRFLLDDLAAVNVQGLVHHVEGVVGVGPRSAAEVPSDAPAAIGAAREGWSRRPFMAGAHSVQDGVLRVEFTGKKDVDYYHGYKIFRVLPNSLYRVSAKVRTYDLSYGKVGIAVEDVRGWKEAYYQASNVNVTGTQPWQWVSVMYRTPLAAKTLKVVARKYRGHGNTQGVAEFGAVTIEKIEGSLPAAPVVTGIASVSRQRDRLSIVLINKKLNGRILARLKLPRGYGYAEGVALHGESPLSRLRSDGGLADFSVAPLVPSADDSEYVEFSLPRHSITGLSFKRTSSHLNH